MRPPISARSMLGWSWVVALVLVSSSLVLQLIDPGLGTDDLTVDDPAEGTRVGEERPVPPFDGFYRLRDLVSVDQEANLTTWFSVCLLLGCALVLWTVAAETHRRGAPWRQHWVLLALGFAYLSVDELTQLHESAGDLAGVGDLAGAPTFSWVLVAVPAVVVAVVVFARFLLALPLRTRVLALVAGTLYVGGAVGMELVGSVVYDTTGSLQTVGYALSTSLEELLEMTGAALFLFAVRTHAERLAEAPPQDSRPDVVATVR